MKYKKSKSPTSNRHSGRVRTGYLDKIASRLLEESSKKKLKHPKTFTQIYVCTNCQFKQHYKSLKCPICNFPN